MLGSRLRFAMVIVDEATQSLECNTLVPIERAGAELEHLVLIGDHKQLPPTVLGAHFWEQLQSQSSQLSPCAFRFGSLMERLVSSTSSSQQQENKMPIFMLREQRRMAGEIASFSNEWFYGGRLQNWVDERDLGRLRRQLRAPLEAAGVVLTSSTATTEDDPESEAEEVGGTARRRTSTNCNDFAPVQFVDVPHRAAGSEFRKNGGSLVNEQEAERVVAVLANLVAKLEQTMAVLRSNPRAAEGDYCYTVGVITPYAAQEAVLKRLLDKRLYNRSWQLELPDHERKVPRVTVMTVDGCQGSEHDVVLFSTVRSNAGGELGFLADPRRMNVALTRAKSLFLVFGDAECLRGNSTWCRGGREDVNLWPDWVQRFHFDRRNGRSGGGGGGKSSRKDHVDHEHDETSDGDELEKHNKQQLSTTGGTSWSSSWCWNKGSWRSWWDRQREDEDDPIDRQRDENANGHERKDAKSKWSWSAGGENNDESDRWRDRWKRWDNMGGSTSSHQHY